MKGKVKWYNIKQGYGFIEGEDGIDVFVHKNNLPFWTIFLKTGDKVKYETQETKKGIQAIDIENL